LDGWHIVGRIADFAQPVYVASTRRSCERSAPARRPVFPPEGPRVAGPRGGARAAGLDIAAGRP
jgi:hypothetical protein